MENETKITDETAISSNGVLGAVRNSMGVYCKCGKIIFAVTCEHLKMDKEAQRDLMKYMADGYRTENVSKEQVKELFGCDCT